MNRDLKKLSRMELLEIMIEQGKEIEQLRGIIAAQEAQLSDRKIEIDRCGSLAEASLSLSGVMEAAQKAADQYLENAERVCALQTEKSEQMLQEAEAKCAAMLAEMEAQCESMKAEAERYCRERMEAADAEASAKTGNQVSTSNEITKDC